MKNKWVKIFFDGRKNKFWSTYNRGFVTPCQGMLSSSIGWEDCVNPREYVRTYMRHILRVRELSYVAVLVENAWGRKSSLQPQTD